MGCHNSRVSHPEPQPRAATTARPSTAPPPYEKEADVHQQATLAELRQQGIERGMRAFAEAQRRAAAQDAKDQARERAALRAVQQEEATRRMWAEYSSRVAFGANVAAFGVNLGHYGGANDGSGGGGGGDGGGGGGGDGGGGT